MAILWADGFDHYGSSTTGMTNMLLGPWAEITTTGSGHGPQDSVVRNGPYAWKTSTDWESRLRRVLGGPRTTIGLACAFQIELLPNANDGLAIMQFNDAANGPQVTLVLQSTGILTIKLGGVLTGSPPRFGGTDLVSSTVPVIAAGTWHHIEMKWVSNSVDADGADGYVAVRVNEVEAAAYNGDVCATANLECSQIHLLRRATGSTGANGYNLYVDDVYAWNDSGDGDNDDWIGDKDVLIFYPDADGSTDEWTALGGGTKFSEVIETEAAPAAGPDGDTSYIQAVNSGDIQELEVETLPTEVSGIIAVVLVNMMKKTEAGASNVTPGIISNGSTATGTAHSMTEAYAYYHDVIANNPDGAIPWTATTLGDAKIKLHRTT